MIEPLLRTIPMREERKRNHSRKYSSAPQVIIDCDVDLNRLKLASLGLYGRDSEKAKLLEACNRVRNASKIERQSSLVEEAGQEVSRSPELVLISGISGAGKSALAQSIKSDVGRAGCFFVSGKFSIGGLTEPYTAFLSVFNSLCDLVLSSRDSSVDSPDRVSALKILSSIRDAISSESSSLMGIIPKLSLLLDSPEGTSNENARTMTEENFVLSRNKLNFLLRQFIHSYCSQKTIVMLLDDLQWADTASLELLKVLISDRHNPNLLIIGSFRDDETQERDSFGNVVDEMQERDYPLATCLDEIHASTNTAVTAIHLDNLDVNATNDIIAHALTMTTDKTHNLAEIVHKKTYGNPLAIIHCLKTMQDEGFLQYCLGTLAWRWEENKIQTCICATDNVVELLISKIKKKLPMDVRKVLQIAACLGGTFDPSTISLVSKKIKSVAVFNNKHRDSFTNHYDVDSAHCLDVCVDEGLLETDGNLEYRFVHDQVSTACFSLIPEDRRDLIRYQIGEALTENLPASEVEKDIFVVVGLLNHGIGLVSNNEKKCIELSRLNLQAATKAMNVSAYGSGAIYIKTGIYLLGARHWTTQKSLSLALYTTGAKIEYCNGNLDKMQNYLDKIFEQNLPMKEKAEAQLTHIFSLIFLRNNCNDACIVALDVLGQLGVHIPRKPSKLTIISSFLKTKLMLKRFDTDKLCDLPVINDETNFITMRILSQMQAIAFLSFPKMFPLIATKSVQICIREGISKFSSFAFAGYGMMLAAIGSINEAKRYADVAIALVQKFKAKDIETKVLFLCYNFIFNQVKPFFQLHKLHLQAYEMGLQVGDVTFAFMNLRCAFAKGLVAGKPLTLLESQVSEAVEEMEDYNQKQNIILLRIFWQFLLNMMGRSSSPLALTGEALHQEEYVKLNGANINSSFAVIFLKTLEYWAAFYFGDLELFLTLQKQLNLVGKTSRTSSLIQRTALFEGLIAFSLARTKKSRKWKKQASKITSRVQAWVDSGDINFKHILLMLEAEMAALNKKQDKAHKKYKRVIAICSRVGLNHDRALANERFGEYLLETGEKDLATHHITVSYQSYMRWGANAKANHIRKKYATLLNEVDFEELDENDGRG